MGKVIETVADSIALEILNGNTIITGKGDELHLFTKTQQDNGNGSIWQDQVLATKLTNKVHGIHKRGGQAKERILLVYGEKEFILMTYQTDGQQFEEFYRASLSDWISCGGFITNSNQLILLTAHSIVLRFDYDIAKKSCVLRERVSCTDKSTLYCAHLYGSTWEDIVVLAGNAFGELLIWQPCKNEKNPVSPAKPKVSPLIHRITAHNGVIFSIDYNHESQQLITTSDDRSVKWWRVTFTEKSEDWANSNLQAVASGYGHIARVFKGKIINNGSHTYALSVGEDSYLCLWRSNGELLFKRRQQYGATIWNLAYDYSSKTVYTVGSIGNLVAFGLNHVLEKESQLQVGTLLPQVSSLENPSEYITKVKFINELEIVGITNANRLLRLLHNSDGNQYLDALKSCPFLDFKCTVMETCEDRLAICGFKRILLLQRLECGFFEKIRDQNLLEGVIRAFIFFTKYDFMVCDDKGNCWLHIESQKAERTLELPKCKEPWLTTALLLNQHQVLLISNRQGNLLLYKLANDQLHYDLCDIIKHPHGNMGATQLQVLHESTNEALVRSSGHDGAINVFSINFTSCSMKTCYREMIPVSWVENIPRWFKDQDLFLGFNDNHFVAWSREYDFLLQIPCGGGHRCWDFVINPSDFQISLAFIKNKRVLYYSLPLINKELFNLPPAKKWHVAPCNIMQTIQGLSKEMTIAISAGDDNLIKIHQLTSRGLKQRKEVHTHISNIRCLKVNCLNNNEFVIFSGGGRAQLCVTKVNKKNFHAEEMINYTLKSEANNKPNPANKEEFNFDPETRLMSLDVQELENGAYRLYVGCSDGYLRSLSLNLSTLEIKQLNEYFYNKCILQVKFIDDFNYVLAAGTDGLIKFFNSSLTECIREIQHHCSGINALSTMLDPNRKTLKILSGGDDQSVSYSELDLLNGFTVLDKFFEPSPHTAQVCAAVISSDGRYGYTSSVDQVLLQIDLSPSAEGTHVVRECFRSCVADVKGVCLVQDDTFLLYGCGLQVFTLKQ